MESGSWEEMSGLGSSERERPWNFYTFPDPNPPQAEPPHRDMTSSSMSAISFGIVATAILISMFLIMAIFEHLFKPVQQNLSSSSPSDMQKPPARTAPDSALCMSGFSVVMPGQRGPTHIAKPAPLPPPCFREGINWPQHEHF